MITSILTKNGTESTKTSVYLLASCIAFSFSSVAQCDLELLDFDPVVGEITVAFNNTENCGGLGGPTGVAEIQFGFQALDSDCNAMNQGWDFPWGLSIPDDNNHPGWIYSATTTVQPTNWTNLDVWADYNVDPPYYTGDTITFPLDDFYQAGSMSLYSNLLNAFEFWMDQGLGIQAVIWQISYGPTMYAADGGWAEVGANGDGTGGGGGLYEDLNWQDNWLITCPEDMPEVIYVYDTVYVELPPDTILEYVYDTTYVELPNDTIVEYVYDTTYVELPNDTILEYVYDTTYVELPPDTIVETLTDTLYVTETDTVVINDTIPVPIHWYFYDTTYIYITDTLYITEIDTSYITLTDTIYSIEYQVDTAMIYEYDMVEVDCSTGEPCINPFSDCEIYVPNSFTPDNDGVNDVWGAETDPDCWIEWRMRVFSRSGEVVWESFYPEDIWLGGDEYYVPDDTYIYRVECEGYGESYTINGHVTIIR